MTISIIVATAENGVIGNRGNMPWRLPADLAHFKRITTGHPIIMGRVTHESIGRALPGRYNLVITNEKNYQADGCEVANSLEEALKKVTGEKEVFIIGGASIYEQALPKADRIYLTLIHARPEGDRYFKYDPREWEEVSRKSHKADDKNQHDYDFLILERKKLR